MEEDIGMCETSIDMLSFEEMIKFLDGNERRHSLSNKCLARIREKYKSFMDSGLVNKFPNISMGNEELAYWTFLVPFNNAVSIEDGNGYVDVYISGKLMFHIEDVKIFTLSGKEMKCYNDILENSSDKLIFMKRFLCFNM